MLPIDSDTFAPEKRKITPQARTQVQSVEQPWPVGWGMHVNSPSEGERVLRWFEWAEGAFFRFVRRTWITRGRPAAVIAASRERRRGRREVEEEIALPNRKKATN